MGVVMFEEEELEDWTQEDAEEWERTEEEES